MAYNDENNSELERRFEKLFSQVFRCSWQDYLTAQYPIQGADGKNYFIDYFYQDGSVKIGIELDGRGKFYQYKHVFNNFFQRQNAIQLAGITVYRFTWTDVVEQGGWRARKQLHQIFKDKLQVVVNAPVPVQQQPSGSKLIEYQPSPSQQPPIEMGCRPAIRAMGILVGLLAASLILIGIVGLNGMQAPETQEEINIVHPVYEVPPAPKTQIRTSQTSQKKSPAHGPNRPAVVSSNNKISTPAFHRPAPNSKADKLAPNVRDTVLPPALSQPKAQEQPEQPTLPLAVAPSVENSQPPANASSDDTVAFNQASGVYHKPGSYWAQKCTRNCVHIPKSEAIRMGGRASRAER